MATPHWTGKAGEAENVRAVREELVARLEEGVHLAHMTRHMLGVMHGRAGARAFRRILTVESVKPGAGIDVVDRAVEAVREAEARFEAREDAA